MNTKVLKLEYLKTETTPTWGGSKTIVTYELTTICENVKNHYTVTFEIRGIATTDLYLQFIDSNPMTNNEHTLISSAIGNLLE